MNCLVIDDNPKTGSVLLDLLEEMPGMGQLYNEYHPYRVRSVLLNENIDLVFIRVKLWDFRVMQRLEKTPAIVLISGGINRVTEKLSTCPKYVLREPWLSVDVKQIVRKVMAEKEGQKINQTPDYLFLKYEGRFHQVPFSDILLIEKKPNSYSQFHLKSGEYLLYGSLNQWMPKLPEDLFIRVSDNLVLPVSEIKHIHKDTYTYKNQVIRLTFRFAKAARQEMEEGRES